MEKIKIISMKFKSLWHITQAYLISSKSEKTVGITGAALFLLVLIVSVANAQFQRSRQMAFQTGNVINTQIIKTTDSEESSPSPTASSGDSTRKTEATQNVNSPAATDDDSAPASQQSNTVTNLATANTTETTHNTSAVTQSNSTVATPNPTPTPKNTTPTPTIMPKAPATSTPTPTSTPTATPTPEPATVTSKVQIRAFYHPGNTDEIVPNAPVKLLNKSTGETLTGMTDQSGYSPSWQILKDTEIEVTLYSPREWATKYCGSSWTVNTGPYGTTQAQHLRLYNPGQNPCITE
ncbi:hypothetical protein KA078_02105 [Candidatus Woesebacteria bacterium]|nr:hypothetical protein [Candidatus Woesebacteria bacterium]